jgi:cytidine deaminase
VHEGKKLYRCSICKAYLTDLKIMKNHLVTVHEKEDLLNCKSRELLQMNLFHILEKSQTCHQCGEKLDNKRNLKVHILSKHEGKKVYKCSICENFYFEFNKMKRHIVSVHEKDKKLLNCKPMEFSKMNLFQEMQKSQTCDQCGDKFRGKNELKGHIISVHDKKNLYQCSICRAYLTECGQMKRHLITVHGKENLMNCKPKKLIRMNLFHKIVSVPGKKETISNSVHKTKRLYKCEFCNSKFGIQKLLEAHLKKVHQNDNKQIDGKSQTKTVKKVSISEEEDFVEYQLPYGWKKVGRRRPNNHIWDVYVYGPNGDKFRSNAEISTYLQRNPKIVCDLDVTNTFRMKNMQNHTSKELQKTNLATVNEEKKNYGCDICKRYFSIKSDLMNHIESEHVEKESIEEPSECKILDNFSEHKDALEKKNASSVHEGKKAVKCPVCKENFSTVDQMKSHIGSVHFHLW